MKSKLRCRQCGSTLTKQERRQPDLPCEKCLGLAEIDIGRTECQELDEIAEKNRQEDMFDGRMEL